VKGLLGQMVRWRVALRWYAVALLLPLCVILAAIYTNVFFGAPNPTPSLLATLPLVAPIFVLALLFPLQGAMGEEPGWRGFATPKLQARYSSLATSLLLGGLVALWHAPLFLTGIYGDATLRIVFLVATTALYTLLYNATGGSLLLPMLFHASWNGSAEFLLAPFQGVDRERAIALFLVIGIAVAVIASVLALSRLTRPAPNIVAVPAPAKG
jgi:membrane protease YdiL (CAAX protease family)